MVLILTCDGDLSADLVIDWLDFYQYPYIRINSFELFRCELFFDLDKQLLLIGGKTIPIESINAVWYRKFGFFSESDFYKEIQSKFNKASLSLIQNEFYRLTNLITSLFSEKFWITDPKYVNVNKLDVLSKAQKAGITVPQSYIINTSKDLKKIMDNFTVISKSIHDPILIPTTKDEFKDRVYMMYTSSINNTDYQALPKFFFPSLVQRKISKRYEIRSFYLEGSFYSMAIYSQNDIQTQQDFRKYNWDKPNRNIPYELPSYIEQRLDSLMKDLRLNCGSIDMIVDNEGNYVFLEVNPTGQFGMVDFPCNYGLHKRIAEILIKNDKHGEVSPLH